ncbi:MAG: PilT/PilU family type 4a pilus ATPase [Candidatus Hydrogenedentes bacterium]|nr:PilT/PilU family type 4a pilus ATPase [Candidatus Hydrogenedentota bacterium]
MNEVVVGTGHQQSLRDVIRIVEKLLRATEGIPREVTTRTERMELRASRPEFEGEFEEYVLRLRVTEQRKQTLREVVATLDGACALTEQEGELILRFPPEGKIPDQSTYEAVDVVSRNLTLPEVWRICGDHYRIDRISIELLFQAMVKYRASDVHLSPGHPPIFRVDNDMHHSELLGSLSAQQIRALIKEIAPAEHWDEFESQKQTSFNFHQVGLGYSRVSAFLKAGAPHCTFRFLPEVIPSFEELNIPQESMVRLASLQRGLVLVTGMTGSGKSTTAAALIDWINTHRSLHILSIENPVEYVHADKKSIVSQRSLGTDVATFYEAVTGALRHDPDVIFIGEMRDPDTIRAAINAAATGHLVVSTLHSNTASEVVNRIISFFDPIERDLVRLQLYDSIQCVICQRLIAKIGGGRIPVIELLFKDIKPIADGIKSGNTDLIRIGMQQAVTHSFMFEKYAYALYKQGKITLENAREAVTDVSVFDQLHMGTYSVPRLDSIKYGGVHETYKS